jgi:hypothetical protein
MSLEYHESAGGNYWEGTVGGKQMKFVRVMCGLAVPQLDRQAAAIIILGELRRSFAPADFTGLGAAVGSWSEVKRELRQFCEEFKASHIVTQDEPSRKQVWPVTDALIAIKPLALSYVAPEHAVEEVGRQNVQQLINEERLHIEHLLPILNRERDQADKALRFVVNWALEFTAFYPGKPRKPTDATPIGSRGL